MEESIEKNSFIDSLRGGLGDENLKMMSPLTLAYIGDAVYELYVRTMILSREENVNKLHKKAVKYVKANAQADTLKRLEEVLTDEEKSIVRRGRNAKINTSPKNADLSEYKRATGFESLLGFLFLSKNDKRLIELLEIAHKIPEEVSI
ncbi:MAG: ribonuclease III domain-containing protein [Gudongella sp.]|nr:ribonuclease III domain-containing protein [Gudongella sp.]